MPLKGFVRELREIRDDISTISFGKGIRRRGRSHIAPESASEILSNQVIIDQSPWANLPPELLHDIIQKVEATETSWPARRDVVACASVCKSWREITKEIVKTPEQCGCLTFPISLKQPGPRDAPIQCFIRRERATSTYLLYLGLSPALSGDMSKLLLAAKKIRRAASTDFRISFVGSDFCRTSNTYVGKLKSNFLGTKFTIYDSQPPHPTMQANCKQHRKVHSIQVSPLVPARNYSIATVSYELNVLRTRGPRRMQCTMHSIPVSAIHEGGTAPTPTEFLACNDEQIPPSSISKRKEPLIEFSTTSVAESIEPNCGRKDPLVLKNKAPRWHEQLQCWCLNFKGRVTVASVKNFQLVAAIDPSQNVPAEEQEKVILQFGKIGKDIFTMDYRYPLSAFQAFAICLSSFDTKPACE
ncbi:tubby-like F-box protein 5 [Ricinus communis]|uniref:Tubby-like F-box protein n=1 Tax=Ricinus communis TaxID=3988 RepID=B9R7W3_RICCO|nr:tubby-like F-box protein 5 [Ricinus communis]XP_015575904.1 tubby-like F-box protein 5 [Ricinus communis]XP_048226476.1 tubby-like F-box protein 5 [Ricinus communis]EEF52593.1 phosphoric diester hydrolase, putative [Ricinus communis]|eukprot:XP_002510406.1 tubby-like F-box protein 5 [Ricinus communis]